MSPEPIEIEDGPWHDVLERMLVKDPAERASVEEIKSMLSSSGSEPDLSLPVEEQGKNWVVSSRNMPFWVRNLENSEKGHDRRLLAAGLAMGLFRIPKSVMPE